VIAVSLRVWSSSSRSSMKTSKRMGDIGATLCYSHGMAWFCGLSVDDSVVLVEQS
jgi:hypothetical protein